MHKRRSLLLPLVIAAVVSVATFSGIGIAAITGHLAVSQGGFDLFMPITAPTKMPSSSVEQAPRVEYVGLTTRSGAEPTAERKPIQYRMGQRVSLAKRSCPNCGVVQSIEPRAQREGQGAYAGPPGGNARATAMVLSGNGGVYSEGPERDTVNYVVRVKMEDGSFRTIYESQRPTFSIGERVRLVNGTVVTVG